MGLSKYLNKNLRVSNYIISSLSSFKYFYALYILFLAILFTTIFIAYDSSSQLAFDNSLYLFGSDYSFKIIVSQLLFLYTLFTIIFASIIYHNVMYGHNFEVLISTGYSRTLILSSLLALTTFSNFLFFVPLALIPGFLFLFINLVIHSVVTMVFVLTLSLIIENVSAVILFSLLHFIFLSFYLSGIDTSANLFAYLNYFMPNIFESYLNIPQPLGKIEPHYYIRLITANSLLVALSYFRVKKLEA